MSIKLQLTKEQIENSEEAKVHFIPASINNNGIIKIDEYFNNYTKEENNVYENALRGYPLKGEKIQLPESLQAVICLENDKINSEGSDRVLKFAGKFNEYMYWNYDKTPSENDPYKKCMHWLEISDALHSEVDSV